MPVFEYRGLTAAGKQVKGLLEADSAETLRAAAEAPGVFLTDVLAERESGPVRRQNGNAVATRSRSRAGQPRSSAGKLVRGRVSSDDVAIFTRQLATLLHAGVTLVEALTALVDQVEKERLKRMLSDVKTRVNEGSSLADALGAAREDLRHALREHGARRRALRRAGRGAGPAGRLHRGAGQAPAEGPRAP